MKVTVVIPAYNEENNIGNVLKVLVGIETLYEIIVVDDGSIDSTADIAESYEIRVIRLEDNLGKGGAMMKGAQLASHPNILFLDADLVGLKKEHIAKLIQPVIEESYAMAVGIFEQGRIATDLAQFLAPFLSGQRVVRKELFDQMSNLDATRFGVEVALTKYAKDNNLPVKEVILEDLTHVMKEEKLGLVRGFVARMKMYWEIAKFVSTNIKTGTKD